MGMWSSREDLNVAQLLAVLVTCAIFCAIWIILKPRGFVVQLCTCCFVLSLVCTQLLMKELASTVKFRYPAIVTSLHFLSVWIVAWIFWAFHGELLVRCNPASLGSSRRFFTFVLPIAASLPLSIVFNNTSLLYMGAGLAGVVGTMAPIVTAILTHFLGRRISRHGWIGVLVATCGASFIAFGEADPGKEDGLVLLGLMFCTMSVFLRAVKAVLQDQLLQPAAYSSRSDLEKGIQPLGSQEALTPMHVWALTAPPCTLLALAYAFTTESFESALQEVTPTSGAFVLTSCFSATVLNILGLMSVKQLGASSMQIVGKLNTIVLLALSMGFWGESMPKEVLVGTCFALMGVAIFERGGSMRPAKLSQPS
ncbi:unnamed protein product [Durusdinium trenchii]|uniref:Uncharacterized protein n=2 Tax=Durusdinium trenchii TaxID=1381693 RepID=A0ABP0SDJ5_9DINO